MMNYLLFLWGLKLVHFHQVNTQAPSNVIDCSDRNNSKYYVVVIQVFLSVCLSVSLSPQFIKNLLSDLAKLSRLDILFIAVHCSFQC